jgi:predicted RNA-binding Zn-ribbon protein involved in translation (DUF1610 family)
MVLRTYQFFCGNCGYKRITKGDDIQDLIQVKQSSVPRGSPYVDPFTKKVIVPSSINRVKAFKCPDCGYTIKATKLSVENSNEQTDRTNGRETSSSGQTLPGELT